MVRLFLPLILMLCSLGIGAQPMRELFAQMPDSLLPTLTRNNRLDLIDFIEAGLDNMVSNRLGGESRLTMLTGNRAKLRLSEGATIELCKLEGSQVMCYIHSVRLDSAWHSNLRFYDVSTWKRLPLQQYITMPTTLQFLSPPADATATELQNLEVLAGIPLIHASFTSDTTIHFTFSSANHADSDYRRYILPLVAREGISLEWQSGSSQFSKP